MGEHNPLTVFSICWPIITGLRLRPSTSAGISAPARSMNVGSYNTTPIKCETLVTNTGKFIYQVNVQSDHFSCFVLCDSWATNNERNSDVFIIWLTLLSLYTDNAALHMQSHAQYTQVTAYLLIELPQMVALKNHTCQSMMQKYIYQLQKLHNNTYSSTKTETNDKCER